MLRGVGPLVAHVVNAKDVSVGVGSLTPVVLWQCLWSVPRGTALSAGAPTARVGLVSRIG